MLSYADPKILGDWRLVLTRTTQHTINSSQLVQYNLYIHSPQRLGALRGQNYVLSLPHLFGEIKLMGSYLFFIYIYITEPFGTLTIFHVSTILKKKKLKHKIREAIKIFKKKYDWPLSQKEKENTHATPNTKTLECLIFFKETIRSFYARVYPTPCFFLCILNSRLTRQSLFIQPHNC